MFEDPKVEPPKVIKKQKDDEIVTDILKKTSIALQAITANKEDRKDEDNADYHFCMFIYRTLQLAHGQEKKDMMKRINDAL